MGVLFSRPWDCGHILVVCSQNPQIKRKKEDFNQEVVHMKARKEVLLKELEDISLELINIQYQLDAGKRKPVPTIPIIYPEELTKDPFEVSLSCHLKNALFVLKFLSKICTDQRKRSRIDQRSLETGRRSSLLGWRP